MKKLLRISIFLLVIFFAVPAYAADAKIFVSTDKKIDFNLSTDNPVIDIAVVTEGLKDGYAYSLFMDYDPMQVTVQAIGAGNLFAGLNSAQIKNEIDADAGTAEYMQTLIAVDKGVDTDGTLCIIRLVLTPGVYCLDDLGISVQVVNSVPEYIDVQVSGGIITVNELSDGQPQKPTPTPFGMQTDVILTDDAEGADPSASLNPSDMQYSDDKNMEEDTMTPGKGLPVWAAMLIAFVGILLIGSILLLVLPKQEKEKPPNE